MRKMQEQRRPCTCPAYHFPHRAGSGRCGHQEQWYKGYEEFYKEDEAARRPFEELVCA